MPTPPDLLALADRLANFDETPADSSVAFDTGRPLNKVMASINATTGDLALAKSLGCDGFVLHHPLAGSSRREFHRVLERMIELLVMHGVPEKSARQATRSLRRRLRYNDHASDWDHLASAARHLDISLFNVHLAADELGRRVMAEGVRDLDDEATVEDVIDALREVPELAAPDNEILHVPEGPSGRAGRIAIMHAGGTNGGAEVAEALFDTTLNHTDGPVRTVVYIHLSGDDARKLEERAARGEPGTVVVTGHLASDAIGMNILIDAVEKELGIEILRHGGLTPFENHSSAGARS